MSRIFESDPVFLQRFLRVAGYYRGDMDGVIGPKSAAALSEFEVDSLRVAQELGVFDKKSEAQLATMLPVTQRKARKFLKGINAAGLSEGMQLRIISGTRTYAEQEQLFAKGRSAAGSVVTHARGGQSNHNFGIAWDVGIFTKGGVYIDDLIESKQLSSRAVDAEYKKVGAYGKAMGLFWGGDWHVPDYPHFQMLDNDLLGAVREKFVNGGVVV